MTKQDMIDKIYETIADKTLNFGCLVKDLNSKTELYWKLVKYTKFKQDPNITNCYLKFNYSSELKILDIHSSKIIWHPVLIWDVLDYLQGNNLLSECVEILWVRNNKRKPIENQSDFTIKYVYDLIQTIK